MLNSKKQKLKSLAEDAQDTNKVSSFNMPDMLSNFNTGLDVHKIDLEKLISAPDEWNFYSKLSNSKMNELVESIRNLGLMHPIVVWEQKDGMYMVLSGHNRKSAFEILHKETSDDKYKKIYCYVKKHAELSEDDAKEIIIDTNWVQRQLSSIEKAKSIYEKYTKFRKNRDIFKPNDPEGKTRDVIATQYQITGRQVSNYYRLNFLIPELQEKLEDNTLSIKSGVKLALLHPLSQIYINNNFRDKLNNKIISQLDPSLTDEQIKDVFESSSLQTDNIAEIEFKLLISHDCKASFETELA